MSLWSVGWGTEVNVTMREGKGKGRAREESEEGRKERKKAGGGGGRSSSSDSTPSYINVYPPPSPNSTAPSGYSTLGGLAPQIALIRTLIDLPLLLTRLLVHRDQRARAQRELPRGDGREVEGGVGGGEEEESVRFSH
jgi:hypothetical protein